MLQKNMVGTTNQQPEDQLIMEVELPHFVKEEFHANAEKEIVVTQGQVTQKHMPILGRE